MTKEQLILKIVSATPLDITIATEVVNKGLSYNLTLQQIADELDIGL